MLYTQIPTLTLIALMLSQKNDMYNHFPTRYRKADYFCKIEAFHFINNELNCLLSVNKLIKCDAKEIKIWRTRVSIPVPLAC